MSECRLCKHAKCLMHSARVGASVRAAAPVSVTLPGDARCNERTEPRPRETVQLKSLFAQRASDVGPNVHGWWSSVFDQESRTLACMYCRRGAADLLATALPLTPPLQRLRLFAYRLFAVICGHFQQVRPISLSAYLPVPDEPYWPAQLSSLIKHYSSVRRLGAYCTFVSIWQMG